MALALWQDVALPEAWELLAFPADPASSPGVVVHPQHKKTPGVGKGIAILSPASLQKAKPKPSCISGAKGLAELVTSSQSIPK